MNMQIINFASGSAQIPAINQTVLKKAAVLLKGKTDVFEIAGHADNIGNEANNLTLSETRAKAVRAFLVKQQVPANNITAKGYGSAVPVASNDTETGRLKNRRIEYKLSK
jgi:outer membrane protein OmpA-like peptidoglycan-associated protein